MGPALQQAGSEPCCCPSLVLGKSLPFLSCCGVLVCKMGVTEPRLQGREVKAPGSAQHTGGSYVALVGSEPPIHSEDTNTRSHLCDLQSDDYMVPRKGKKVEVWVPSITPATRP